MADCWVSGLSNWVRVVLFIVWGGPGEEGSSSLLRTGRRQVGTVCTSLYTPVGKVRAAGGNLRKHLARAGL